MWASFDSSISFNPTQIKAASRSVCVRGFYSDSRTEVAGDELEKSTLEERGKCGRNPFIQIIIIIIIKNNPASLLQRYKKPNNKKIK